MVDTIKKEGHLVPFDREKIYNAIISAMEAVGERDELQARKVTDYVIYRLEVKFEKRTPSVEEIQDIVEEQLIESSLSKVAKAYIIYRNKKNELRKKLLVRSEEKTYKNTTEMSLLVSTSTEETVTPWGAKPNCQGTGERSPDSSPGCSKDCQKGGRKGFKFKF